MIRIHLRATDEELEKFTLLFRQGKEGAESDIASLALVDQLTTFGPLEANGTMVSDCAP